MYIIVLLQEDKRGLVLRLRLSLSICSHSHSHSHSHSFFSLTTLTCFVSPNLVRTGVKDPKAPVKTALNFVLTTLKKFYNII